MRVVHPQAQSGDHRDILAKDTGTRQLPYIIIGDLVTIHP